MRAGVVCLSRTIDLISPCCDVPGAGVALPSCTKAWQSIFLISIGIYASFLVAFALLIRTTRYGPLPITLAFAQPRGPRPPSTLL